jgi:hypothetical protein
MGGALDLEGEALEKPEKPEPEDEDSRRVMIHPNSPIFDFLFGLRKVPT